MLVTQQQVSPTQTTQLLVWMLTFVTDQKSVDQEPVTQELLLSPMTLTLVPTMLVTQLQVSPTRTTQLHVWMLTFVTDQKSVAAEPVTQELLLSRMTAIHVLTTLVMQQPASPTQTTQLHVWTLTFVTDQKSVEVEPATQELLS